MDLKGFEYGNVLILGTYIRVFIIILRRVSIKYYEYCTYLIILSKWSFRELIYFVEAKQK